MSFSSRRRNYLLTPHRRDGLIEWMKSMLMHSFVLNALESTGGDTFSHFEMLIDEHREMTLPLPSLSPDDNTTGGGGGGTTNTNDGRPSRLKQLVPTVGSFHTRLPLRRAFEVYNAKYSLTSRRHVTISFNELRHILNLAQIMALSGQYGKVRGRSALLLKGSAGGGGGGSGGDGGDGDVKGLLDSPTRGKDDDDDDEEEGQRLREFAVGHDSPSALLLSHHGDDPPEMSLDDDDDGKGRAASATTTTTTAGAKPPTAVVADETNDDDNNNNNNNNTKFPGPSMITFDGDQTLYSDGANFESNPKLANYLYLLLKRGVTVAVVTAAGYEYQSQKYELRLSGLLTFFQERRLTTEECERFYLFGGECNYLLRLGQDYTLHPVKEHGPGGWFTSTKHLNESPCNWSNHDICHLLDVAEASVRNSASEQKLRSRVIRKKRAVGLIPRSGEERLPREALDETVLRVNDALSEAGVTLPYCAFNGGRDAWVDCGNKRVGVQILQNYLGIAPHETLHIGDQFLNTGNDYAARDVCPCVWITSPEETTYILKCILRLAGVSIALPQQLLMTSDSFGEETTVLSNVQQQQQLGGAGAAGAGRKVDFTELSRRTMAVQQMDVYTGEIIGGGSSSGTGTGSGTTTTTTNTSTTAIPNHAAPGHGGGGANATGSG